jgi:putative sterol carrier protein
LGIFDGIPQDIDTREFFVGKLPGIFDREMTGAEASGMEGTELKVNFVIEGRPYGLKITDGSQIEVAEGGMDDPDIVIELAEEDWRTALSGDLGNALDMFTDFTKLSERRRFDTVKDVSGKLNLVIQRPEGEFKAVARFSGAEAPEATINVDLATWQEIMAGTQQAAMAFMGGKLKLTGDMQLAMALNGWM